MFHQYRKIKPWLPLLAFLALAGAMTWAKQKDPFQRIKFSLNTPSGKMVKGTAVLPKSPAKYPLAIYVYGAGSSLPSVGNQLRRIAEHGLGAVSLEYDQDDQSSFNDQFIALCEYLGKQSWAQKNVAWISSGIGARRALSFAISHPNYQPELLIRIEGGWLPELDGPQFADAIPRSTNVESLVSSPPLIKCPVTLVQSRNDELSPMIVCNRLAALLRSRGVTVQICTLPGSSHAPDLDYPSVLPAISEYAATRLPMADYTTTLLQGRLPKPAAQPFNRALFRAGENRFNLWRFVATLQESERETAVSLIGQLQDYDLAHISTAELKQLCRPGWSFHWKFVGIIVFTVPAFLIIWKRARRNAGTLTSLSPPNYSRPRSRLILWVIACFSVVCAAVVTVMNLISPRLEVNDLTLAFGNKFLLRSHAEDLNFIIQDAAARKKKLGTLLEHVQLANLQREQFYTNLENAVFQRFILSPQIDSESSEWNWRKNLWENFQPRIRKERDPTTAAQIVVECLRERVGIDPSYKHGFGIETMWIQRKTDEAGFQKIYVAALRSVGIAARLNEFKRAELWTGEGWQMAPTPCILFFTASDNEKLSN